MRDRRAVARPSQIPDAAALLKPDDFTGPRAEGVRRLVEMSAAGHGVDGVTVAEFLKTVASSTTATCLAIFVAARDTFSSAANAMAYAGIVRDRARRRARWLPLGGQISAGPSRTATRNRPCSGSSGPRRSGRRPGRWRAGCRCASFIRLRADAIDRRYYGVAPQGMPTESPDLDARCCMGCSRWLYVLSGGGHGEVGFGLQLRRSPPLARGNRRVLHRRNAVERAGRTPDPLGRADLIWTRRKPVRSKPTIGRE
ncbi:MAG: hypothetical protein IPP10_14420 [Candidatus Competibacteraceae bacterium]|nr:hypothetical protein [Candidatus Competibacteraceae bacterium]